MLDVGAFLPKAQRPLANPDARSQTPHPLCPLCLLCLQYPFVNLVAHLNKELQQRIRDMTVSDVSPGFLGVFVCM